MHKKRSLSLIFLLLILLLLTACGKDFEGSGSKEAASAKQLAMRLEDPWQKPIVKKRDRLEGTYKDGTYEASAYGMEGIITLKVSIRNNVLTVLSIKQECETQSVGGYEAIRDGLYAKQIEASQSLEIDGLAGASVTTAAIKTALRSILESAKISDTSNLILKDGQYSATAKGFGGDIKVNIVIKKGKVIDVKVEGDKETAGKGGLEAIKDNTFAKRLLEKGSNAIDGVMGATITSNAVKDAMQLALEKAKEKING